MKVTKTIEGVGIGVNGYEMDAVYKVPDDLEPVCASELLPSFMWENDYAAATLDLGAPALPGPLPRLHRFRITVESEELSQEESDAAWAEERRRQREPYAVEGDEKAGAR